MAQEFSFDAMSKVDTNLVAECVQVAMKEVSNRFDFKGMVANAEFNPKELALTLTAQDEFKLKSLWDVVSMRLAKRGLPLKNFKLQRVEAALGGTARQAVKVQQGIPSDKAKEIVAELKKSGLKVGSAIQGDQVRVSGRSKDELQAALALLKGKDFGLELQFGNYR